MMYEDGCLRLQALEWAIEDTMEAEGSASVEAVITRAKAYHEFLEGKPVNAALPTGSAVGLDLSKAHPSATGSPNCPPKPEIHRVPQYASHKKVRALQIRTVERSLLSGWIFHFVDPRFPPRNIPREPTSRYVPKNGDYLVVYEDGYEMISPRKAFEEGYTKIDAAA